MFFERASGNAVESSPAIAGDGTIYVGCGAGYFYAFHPDGTLKWKFQTRGWIASSPAIDREGIIYVNSGDGYLYALHPDGTFKWKFQTQGVIRTSPAVDREWIIYASSGDSALYAVHPDGTLKWKFPTGRSGAGQYREVWDGRDESGQAQASGVYFYRLRAGEWTETRRLLLLR